MKQTNNAIKFLMAQYRAIFKKAYLSGVASAVVLTAGLAAGAANAVSYNSVNDLNQAIKNGSITIGSGDSLELSDPTPNAGTDEDPGLINGNLIIDNHQAGKPYSDLSAIIWNKGSASADETDFYKIKGDLELKSDAALWLTTNKAKTHEGKLDVAANNVKLASGSVLHITAGNDVSGFGKSTVTLRADKVDVNNATVNLLNSQNSAKTSGSNAFLIAKEINVSGKEAKVNIGNTKLEQFTNEGKSRGVLGINAKRNADGTVHNGYKDGSVITINNGATVNMHGVDLSKSDSFKYDYGYGAAIQGSKLTMDNAFLNVSGYGAEIKVHQTQLNSTYTKIESGSTLMLLTQEYETYEKEDNQAIKSPRTNFNGNFDVNGGTLVLDGSMRMMVGGTLSISDDTDLTAGGDYKGFNSTISIGHNNETSSSTFFYTNTQNATLKISSKKLDEFLNSTDEVIKDIDGKTQIKDNQGSLALSPSARLHFTDDSQVEMSKFKFASGNGAGHIWFTGQLSSGGEIGSDDPSTAQNDKLKDNIEIFAKDMSIAKTLMADSTKLDDKSTNPSLQFDFVANKLTLGSEKDLANDWNGYNSKSSTFGAHNMVAFDEVHFVDGTGENFYLNETITLKRDFYVKDQSSTNTAEVNKVGLIKGDNLVLAATPYKNGTLKITGGHWKNEGQSLTIKTGKSSIVGFGILDIIAGASDRDPHTDGINFDGTTGRTYITNANPTTLTWTGEFGFDSTFDATSGTKGLISITGQAGANAALDLRGASINWGHGSIYVQGDDADTDKFDPEASAGAGFLAITGEHFKKFIGNGLIKSDGSKEKTKTAITLGDDGVLYVEGAISGDVDFNKFNSGSGTEGVVGFSGNGALLTTGQLSLITGWDHAQNTASQSRGQSLQLGQGAISAQAIHLNDKSIEANNPNDPDNNYVTVESGTLDVAQGLFSQNNTIVFGNNSNNAYLNLYTGDINESGLVNADLKFVGTGTLGTNNNSSLSVGSGKWSLAEGKDIYLSNAAIYVGSSEDEYTGNKASLKADNLNIDNNGLVIIHDGSAAEFTTLQAGADSYFNIYGNLTILGRADIDSGSTSTEIDPVKNNAATAGVNLADSKIYVSNGRLTLGEAATYGLIDLATAEDANTPVTVKDEIDNATISLDNQAELYLSFSGGTIDAAQAKSLKDQLVGNLKVGDGYINVGQADLGIEYTDKANLVTTWKNVEPFVTFVSEVTNNNLKKTLVTDIETGTEVAGQFGALRTKFDNNTKVQVVGNLGLHAARDGYFIAHGDATQALQAVGVNIHNDAALNLVGSGKIGAISGVANSSELSLNASLDENGDPISDELIEIIGNTNQTNNIAIRDIGEMNVNVDTKVTGAIANVDHASVTKTLDNTGFDSQYNKLDVWNGGLLKTDNLAIHGTAAGNLVAGKVEVAKVLTLGKVNTPANQTKLYVADGELKADQIVVNNNSSIHVGFEDSVLNDDPNTPFDESASHSGKLETNVLSLNKGSLVIDPDFSLKTAVTSVNRFDASLNPEAITAGTVNGSIFVGQNSSLGIGTENLAELSEVLSDYQSNGKLVDFGSVLAVGKQFTLGSGDSLVLTAASIKDFNTYIDGQIKSGSKLALGAQGTDHTKLADTIFLGDNTALVVAPDAFHKIGASGAQTALISAPNATVVADGGEIIIDGDVRANEYKVFDAAAIKYIDGNEYRPVDATTGEITINEDKDIRVSTENNFLVGYVENNGTVALGINPNGRAIMSRASNPVYEALESYAKGYVGDSLAADGSNALKGYDNKDHLVASYHNNDFLQQTISTGDGAAAETVARLGVYGGAAQVALAAGNTTSEAISGRMGMGMNTALTQANNGQGAGMWVSPIYRSHSSDSLGAQGVNYGVDVNVYGVALGGDFTMANGLRVGAMFNVGSGDADGQDAGASVSNDFDYYGFGAYVGYTYDKFTVLGDISYTVADNDVTGSTSIESVKTSFDSSNLSFGVTGQYSLDLGNDFLVMPHAGLRFSKIDLDNYTVKGSNDVAHFSAESLNVFSVPVGVTFSKEYIGESWTVKPSLDITLTGNFGDDSLDGDVNWSGVYNYETVTSTEVLDSFTYGATAGFSATTGSFTMGVGVSYTGSSNTDEFGLNANARFLF